MLKQCRTCGAKSFNPNVKNLFDQDDNEILFNIEIITGIRLTEDQDMPKHICACCYLDLYHSIAFRERCIRTQKYLLRGKQKTTGDPLITAKSNVLFTDDSKNDSIDSRIEEDHLHAADTDVLLNNETKVEEHPELFTSDTGISSQNSSKRILRARPQNANEPSKKVIQKRKNGRSASSSTLLNASARCSQRNREPSPCTSLSYSSSSSTSSAKELNQFSDFDEISSLSELEPEPEPASAREFSPPVVSPVNESSVKTDALIPPVQPGQFTVKRYAIKTGKSNVKTPVNSKALTYICDQCGLLCTSTKNWEIHLLRHKGEKNFECEECGWKFYSKYLLKLHIRVKHQGEMPFPCRFCGQRFSVGTTRTRHEEVIHVRNFAFECKICGKKYNTKTCLKKHEFLHTGLKPFRCDLCNVAFPRNPGLKIHFRTKQHQKRASEALNNQLNVNKEITVTNVIEDVTVTDVIEDVTVTDVIEDVTVIDVIEEIAVTDGALVFPDLIMEQLDM